MTDAPERTYLYVTPEEGPQAQAAGASWDDAAKCWYIAADADPAAFAQWLPDSQGDDSLEVTSTQAYVATTQTACLNCHATIEIISIFCKTGLDGEEPLTDFTVSNIFAMDDSLARQLTPWPHFKKGFSPTYHSAYFANHCPHCHTLQEDLFLHEEPGDPFFSIPHDPPDPLQLIPLTGEIHLSGSCHFSI